MHVPKYNFVNKLNKYTNLFHSKVQAQKFNQLKLEMIKSTRFRIIFQAEHGKKILHEYT